MNTTPIKIKYKSQKKKRKTEIRFENNFKIIYSEEFETVLEKIYTSLALYRRFRLTDYHTLLYGYYPAVSHCVHLILEIHSTVKSLRMSNIRLTTTI